MKLLSIYIGHNSTIAYSDNHQVKYVLHEEKFDNVKNSDNFPIKALQYLSQKEDLKNLDKVMVISKAINRRLLRYIPNYSKSDKYKMINTKPTMRDHLLYRAMKHTPRLMNRINDSYIRLRKKLFTGKVIELIEQGIQQKLDSKKIEFIGHHDSHALSVLHFYGLHTHKDPILVFTLDGGGDRHCATVKVREDQKLKTLATVRNRYSLGDIWSKAFTGGLGMTPLEHEYKVMGLAAYTEKKYYQSVYDKLFKNTIKLKGLTRTSKIPGNKSHIYYHSKLRGLRFDNIAGALQQFTEDTVLQRIHNAVEHTGIKKIAVAGGVFMNIKLNKKLQEQKRIDEIYFMPSAGDDSTPLGGILAAYLDQPDQLQSMNTMYTGIRYSDEEVENFLASQKEKYTIKKFGDETELINMITDLLQNFEIVALCRGAGERGARSLCNRAILGNASDLLTFHTVNDMIKMRDFWMPFAPTMLAERGDKYIQDRNIYRGKVQESSKYMITAFDSTPLAQQHLRAAIHQKDKTLRPQMVTPESNPFMHKLLKNYETKTGMGGVMNTSLNIHGYPLVGTLEQAMFTLENSGLKHLVLNNWLVSKKG